MWQLADAEGWAGTRPSGDSRDRRRRKESAAPARVSPTEASMAATTAMATYGRRDTHILRLARV